jgi:hypothetical protein
MAFAGVLCSLFLRRVPRAAVQGILAGTVALTGILIYESGVAAGQYGTIFVPLAQGSALGLGSGRMNAASDFDHSRVCSKSDAGQGGSRPMDRR